VTTAFTILSLCVAAYRIRRRLFTRAEWILLALWAGHFLFELAVMYGEFMRFRFEARFFRPAEFLTWGWLAWGVVRLWCCGPGWRRMFFALLGLVLLYDGIMLTRAKIPAGRRNAYAAACDWAAEKIREDWKGPACDTNFVFTLGEYRTDRRPVVDCHSARVPYLVGGRSNGMDDGVYEQVAELDRPDYWIQDLRTDDPPTGSEWELMGTFRRGKYELPLYRRVPALK